MLTAAGASANNSDPVTSDLASVPSHGLVTPHIPADVFPTAAMAEQFSAYLAWTKSRGLSRLAAFERLEQQVPGPMADDSATGLLSPEMSEQFAAYLRWTEEQGLGRFYAFKSVDFD
jgi:hypothetical protein